MTADIVRMTDFNGDQVIRHFGLAPQFTNERAAMSFMFRQMKEEVSPNSKEDLNAAAKLAIDEIEHRFKLYNEFSPDFFDGMDEDLSALSVAIICGQYVRHINDAYPEEYKKHGENSRARMRFRCDMGDMLAFRAHNLYDEAIMLIEKGNRDGNFLAPLAPVFLAQTLVHERLHQFITTFNEGDFDEDELYEIGGSVIPNTKTFLRTDTAFGWHLQGCMDYVLQKITPYAIGGSVPPPRGTSQPHNGLAPDSP